MLEDLTKALANNDKLLLTRLFLEDSRAPYGRDITPKTYRIHPIQAEDIFDSLTELVKELEGDHEGEFTHEDDAELHTERFGDIIRSVYQERMFLGDIGGDSLTNAVIIFMRRFSVRHLDKDPIAYILLEVEVDTGNLATYYREVREIIGGSDYVLLPPFEGMN